MKKFDLEKAKNGAAVCLGDGTPVRILDFDFNGRIAYKFIPLDIIGKGVMTEDGRRTDGWLLDFADQDGIATYSTTNNKKIEKRDRNLFMAPVYAYAAIYKNTNSKELYSGKLVPTKEEAETMKDSVYPELEKFCIGKIELLDD